MKITIGPDQAGKRVDRILQEICSDISRSQIQKQFFDMGLVRIGDKTLTKHYRVKSGDVIDAQEIASRVLAHDGSARGVEVAPAILFEHDAYIVLNKPSGLLVHPTAQSQEYTVVDFLLSYYPPIKKVGDDPLRPGIVHRLDKDASGVMVAAKTQEAFDVLKKQFKLRQVKKEYLVLVYGEMPRSEGDITFSLGRSRHSPRIAAKSSVGSRHAETHYVLEEHFSRYSLVRVTPRTGRTHQIRVHFFAYDHPVVGDPIYVPKKIKTLTNTRLMLHATRLGFYDEKNQWQEYVCPPGKDFEAVLELLRTVR
ncbi:RluA family pseudouridine synthase [Candidatus Uhrbacteria bacterium]|nr:RluA family pseudouridine synthase [Candidatus Uhrbacteria bacterium]